MDMDSDAQRLARLADDIDYGVCGCSMCGVGIYDGIIVYVLKDGTKVNRFKGKEGWGDLEERVDQFIEQQLTMED